MSGPIQNSDGTQITGGGTGDIVHDEAVAVPTANNDQTLADTGTTTRKLPVSKIVTGRKNQNDGPVHAQNPFPVSDNELLGRVDRMIELMEQIVETNMTLIELMTA